MTGGGLNFGFMHKPGLFGRDFAGPGPGSVRGDKGLSKGDVIFQAWPPYSTNLLAFVENPAQRVFIISIDLDPKVMRIHGNLRFQGVRPFLSTTGRPSAVDAFGKHLFVKWPTGAPDGTEVEGVRLVLSVTTAAVEPLSFEDVKPLKGPDIGRSGWRSLTFFRPVNSADLGIEEVERLWKASPLSGQLGAAR